MKKQNGITLIALVITIIVLLILAGVSIAMLTGDNGILTKATDSKTATSKAEVMEKINMELNGQMANAMAEDPFDAVDTIKKNLGLDNGKINGYTISVELGGTKTTEYDTGNTVTITITDAETGEFQETIGKVMYDTTNSKWTITPVKVKADTTTPTEPTTPGA